MEEAIPHINPVYGMRKVSGRGHMGADTGGRMIRLGALAEFVMSVTCQIYQRAVALAAIYIPLRATSPSPTAVRARHSQLCLRRPRDVSRPAVTRRSARDRARGVPNRAHRR